MTLPKMWAGQLDPDVLLKRRHERLKYLIAKLYADMAKLEGPALALLSSTEPLVLVLGTAEQVKLSRLGKPLGREFQMQ